MEVTREEFDTLKARFEEVAARVYSQVPQKLSSQAVEEALAHPMWICREMAASDGAFSAGTDWEPQFEQGGVTYVDYGLATNTGELQLHLDTSHGRAAKNVLRWNYPINRTVNFHAGADNFGRIQYKINSQATTEIIADTNSSFNVRAGENILILMTNGSVDRLDFKAGLF